LSDNRAYYCVEDKGGNIWIATYGGGVNLLPKGQTAFLNPKKGMHNYPINAYQKVRTVAIDKDGKVWAGTTDGVLILSYNNGEVEVQRLKESEEEPEKILMSNDIVCIDRDMHGMMWVGTNGGGLAHTIGQDSEGNWLFEQFGSKDGLPSEEIKSLTFDSRGNVWFSTDHNICSFDIGKRIFATYSSLEGVDQTICSEASAVTLPNGHLLFGTIDGYYHVDLQKLITSTGSTLKLRITDFWVDDVLQSPRLTNLYDCYIPDTKKVTIPEHDSKIAFRFASLNYQLQHRVHYQYMLEGYDDDWINADKTRTATYEDIPAGTYKFKVKAFLINSPDKYDMREIEVVVPPPFFLSFDSVWLYLILLAVATIVFMLWLQKRRQQREKSRKKKGNIFDEKEDQTFMDGVNSWMESNYNNPTINFNSLISQLSVSLADFENQLKRITNMTPKEYITYYRIRKAQEMLEQTNDSIADISFNTGFPNAVQFNRLFQEKLGVTPSQYRDKRKEELSGNSDTSDYEIIE
jgi:AraC-like DNA-binding protein